MQTFAGACVKYEDSDDSCGDREKYTYHPEYHGVRLDVMAEEEGTRRRFNVEMQVKTEIAWQSGADTIMHRWIWMHYLQEKVMTSWQIHMSFLSVTLILLEIVCIGIR